MKRMTISFLLLCGVLLCGCNDTATAVTTPATKATESAVITVPAVTTAATTATTAPDTEPKPLWKKVEILNNGWEKADSEEALNRLYAEFADWHTTVMRCEQLKITFRMQGNIEITAPFEEAFASVKDKSIAAWNDSHDPFVLTAVTLRYEDCDPQIIWALAQREDVLYVLIESCDPPMVDEAN